MQTAALPWRIDAGSGKVEVLLITSRTSGKWIIPKGWPMRGKTLAEAAAVEAYEEAGVRGTVDPLVLGTFEHLKNHRLLGPMKFLLVVHSLAVEEVLDAWPEEGERARRWFELGEAIEAVASAELKGILSGFGAAGAEHESAADAGHAGA